eukprot:TRINITY_DN99_c0_g3_i1.p1 TRINITY_DN99_c0_g3~~TRINITY_DN99_c0_g3_i1.p1  ORF type:complete len:934 (-),score=225.27 TRINITY_DN99_c0_g3_i1:76-2877(-)
MSKVVKGTTFIGRKQHKRDVERPRRPISAVDHFISENNQGKKRFRSREWKNLPKDSEMKTKYQKLREEKMRTFEERIQSYDFTRDSFISPFRVDCIVTLVNPNYFLEKLRDQVQPRPRDTFTRNGMAYCLPFTTQIEFSNLIVIDTRKSSLEKIKVVREVISVLNPKALVIECNESPVPSDMVLDTRLFVRRTKPEIALKLEELNYSKTESGLEMFFFENNERPIEKSKLEELFTNLDGDQYGGSIIRSIGTFYTHNGKRYVWESYGKRAAMFPKSTTDKRNAFVFFGEKLNCELIRKELEACILSQERMEMGKIGILNIKEVEKLNNKQLPQPENLKEAIYLAGIIQKISEKFDKSPIPRKEDVGEKIKVKDIALNKQVDLIKACVRDKPNWRNKLVDKEIQKRYRDELLAQGASEEAIFQAFSDLLDTEIIVNPFNLEVALDHAILYRDNLVPKELKESLEKALDNIAYASKKDFHPVSQGLVQDLIHPSLYPYIPGASYVKEGSSSYEDELERIKQQKRQEKNKKRKEEKMDIDQEGDELDVEEKSEKEEEEEEEINEEDESDEEIDVNTNGHLKKKSKSKLSLQNLYMATLSRPVNPKKEYKPLKMVSTSNKFFDADTEGYPWDSRELHNLMDGDHQWIPAEFDITEDGSKIVSYINNLPKEKHQNLYGLIEKVFDKALPHLKEVLRHVSPLHDSNGDPKYHLRPSSNNQFYVASKKWNPMRLQVIVKAANYVIAPGQTYEGNWHVEGTPMERIVASAIYYYHNSPNLEDDGLAFRNLTQKENYNERRTSYGGVNLGAFRTNEDRMIVFANNIQHRVTRIKNPSNEVGERKILCFFLVHPERRILSSEDIPKQQWDEVCPQLRALLLWIGRNLGVSLNKDCINLILQMAKWGFTSEEAELERLKLMAQRKYFKDAESRFYEREWSLCEH